MSFALPSFLLAVIRFNRLMIPVKGQVVCVDNKYFPLKPPLGRTQNRTELAKLSPVLSPFNRNEVEWRWRCFWVVGYWSRFNLWWCLCIICLWNYGSRRTMRFSHYRNHGRYHVQGTLRRCTRSSSSFSRRGLNTAICTNKIFNKKISILLQWFTAWRRS